MKKDTKGEIEEQIDEWLGYWHKSKSTPIGVRWMKVRGKWFLEIFAGGEDGKGYWPVLKRVSYKEVLSMHHDGTLEEFIETEKAIAIISGYECNL